MNMWSKQAAMLTRRTRAAAAVLEGHLYVIGGNDGDMALSSGEAVVDIKPQAVRNFVRHFVLIKLILIHSY